MRHSTIGLTMDVYAKADQTQAVEAVGTLPDLAPEQSVAKATGTDDAVAEADDGDDDPDPPTPPLDRAQKRAHQARS